MMKKCTLLLIALAAGFLLGANSCDAPATAPPRAITGVQQTTAQVTTGIDGLTVEQRNVKKRLEADNKPSSIKHLYVISAYTGQVLIYSTVDGKVTSSGKRLSPTSVAASGGQYVDSDFAGIPVDINGYRRRTTEVLQDDGTYGSSVEYVYWFDTKGNYHQHYITGGQIFHVSDAPLGVKDVVIRIASEED